MDVYSILVPIEDSNLFLLINVKCFVEKFKIKIPCKFTDCYSKQFYFFPFTQCMCKNHNEQPECILNLCHNIKLKPDNKLGYTYISNRMIDRNIKYVFYVLLFQSVKLSELNLTNLEYCLFPFQCDDNYLLFGKEVKDAIRYHTENIRGNRNVNLSMLNVLPFECYNEISFESILSEVNQTDWMRLIFKKTCDGIQNYVYQVFMNYSYPCYKMAYPQFLQFMSDQKIDKKEISNYFRCFDVTSEGFINFHHFLIATGCMDINTVHGGQIGELRSRYIFSFYDEDNDGFISTFDIRRMIVDIHRKKNKSCDDKVIDEVLNEAIRIFDIKVENLKIKQDSFLTAVGNLLFRGTSTLFRFSPDVSFSIKAGNDFSKLNTDDKVMETVLKVEKPNCDYILAIHSVKVHNEGTVSNVRPIWEDIKNSDQLGELGNKFNLTFNRLHSINSFNKESCPNEIIEALKYFRYPDPAKDKPEFHWGCVKMDCLANYLGILCEDVLNIFAKENRLIELKSPAYVLGDLHGNYVDLMKFEDTLWRLGIGLSPGNFLFLGDFVDRGKYGVEVIAYLFAQKVLNPTQLYLLRGNHEIRSIQEQFSFKNECIKKFGEEFGSSVWTKINLTFDFLPIAAVIDEKLFCVHGGIPRPSLLNFKHSESEPMSSLRAAINKIPLPLVDPELQSPLSWEIMWSDPDRNSKDTDTFDSESFTDIDDFGFKFNNRRRTAYCFNRYALESFLCKYHFSHVIRAHEVQKIGFNIELDAKLITVFSSSHYCNNVNEAACVFVNQGKLRLIRLDTSDNDLI